MSRTACTQPAVHTDLFACVVVDSDRLMVLSANCRWDRVTVKLGNEHSKNLSAMHFNDQVNPTSAHELYLKLFITNGGGW